MDSKFFNLIAPFLSTIDDGRFFRKPVMWLYMLMALINVIIPFFLLYRSIENRFFDSPAIFIFVLSLVWLAIAFACWVGFQIWWDRKDKVNLSSTPQDDFVAIPVFSHFVQTLGEWLGTWIAIVGFVFALLATILLGKEGYYLGREIGLGFFSFSAMSIILMPVYGFLIVIVTRFFAEAFKALVAIANNTKRL
jgi:hypothetical protein